MKPKFPLSLQIHVLQEGSRFSIFFDAVQDFIDLNFGEQKYSL